jgi:Helicase conserved C-terminal domain
MHSENVCPSYGGEIVTTAVRSNIVDFLFRELVGPDPGLPAQQLNREEILRPQDPPRLRYSAGVLFPRKASVAIAETATEAEVELASDVPPATNELDNDETGVADPRADSRGEGEVPTDQEVNRANEYLPSAMGISTLVRFPNTLLVRVRAGYYTKETVTGLGHQDRDGNWQPHWFRHAIDFTGSIDCAELRTQRSLVRSFQVMDGEAETPLRVHVYSRPYFLSQGTDSDRIVTFTLLNDRVAQAERPRDDECYFQCSLDVTGASGEACFLEYPDRTGLSIDDEEKSLQLLFAHVKTFAVGHGCAADWVGGKDAVSQVGSRSMPTFEIKPIIPRAVPGLELSMLALSTPGQAAVEICTRLAEGYGQWIRERREESEILRKELREAARRHLDQCEAALIRIRGGIALLESDRQVSDAFALMNRAMLAQQLHYELASNPLKQRRWEKKGSNFVLSKPYEKPDLGNPPAGRGLWRPFQLAFVLMNLRSMSDRTSNERNIVDLIWFPTGGGKTEAYLGLTAFTIFWRRLDNPDNDGTTALMRYTLRLLTTQQYQRAASLICACEMQRRERKDLGTTPISIGLWVGGDVTPIRHDGAVKSLQQLLEGGRDNPFIMLNCPWCGAQMGPLESRRGTQVKGYRQLSNPKRVEFGCDDPACDFNGGLPLHVVDDAIYVERPTLVIGTVDKFALLPWYPQARSLFALDTNGRSSPPDLVIQDELHLISGPLGSMVGHYETAINELCTWEHSRSSVSAKIVASTATICRAGEQVQNLYARPVFLFPPQGLKAGESFFASEDTSAPGRLYVGVFTTALSSHVTAQIRVMAALLQAAKSVESSGPAEIDPYWTLMSYFNSLRELGHAATLIRADITDYLNAMWDRLEIRPDGTADPRRFINSDRELTSRIQSSEIPDVLQQLFTRWDGTKNSHPIDVCLATNMIQVGLDVPRLGLMTVVGQPKTTSEYIQATSRVGRSFPGLVATVYNPSKPRDRSHFEHFRSYHEAIYRWVEPTSVTPFAIPVRDRALHALAVTLVRYLGGDASRSSPQPWGPIEDVVPRVTELIIKRVREIDPGEEKAARAQLKEFFADWRRNPPSRYGDFKPPSPDTPLMYPAGTQKLAEWSEPTFQTPSSMRNVDSTCDARVIARFPQPEES